MINAHTRLLFFAPHPDDESLAGGGLLQRAVAAGAEVRVVFATNGDNNPWPHRLVQRQWKIEVGDQMLWGMRRAQEALDALDILGLPASAAEFLHLPDQRVTELFLRNDPETVRRITRIVEQFRPTLLVAPAPFDIHPDHSALWLLIQQACLRAACAPPEQLAFAVHGRGYHSDWHAEELNLSMREQIVKRAAVLSHDSQMILSRRRFLAHVTPRERFWRATAPRENDPGHPVRSARVEANTLVLQLRRRQRAGSFARCRLMLALEHGLAGRAQRWVVSLPANSRRASVCEASSGAELALAQVRTQGVHAEVRVPLPAPETLTHVFAKLLEPALFFDVAGWREIPTAPTLAPASLNGHSMSLAPQRRRRLLPLRAKAAR